MHRKHKFSLKYVDFYLRTPPAIALTCEILECRRERVWHPMVAGNQTKRRNIDDHAANQS